MSFRLQLRVVPNAAHDEYLGLMDDGVTHRIKLSAPPVDGKANKALMRFLLNTLHLPSGSVTLCAGTRSRNKVVEIDGPDAESVARLLNER